MENNEKIYVENNENEGWKAKFGKFFISYLTKKEKFDTNMVDSIQKNPELESQRTVRWYLVIVSIILVITAILSTINLKNFFDFLSQIIFIDVNQGLIGFKNSTIGGIP